MNSAVLTTPPIETLFGAGRLGACIGAIALVSLIAFEAMAVAAAMPAIAAALDGTRLYALAFGGFLATSMFGMVLGGRWSDRAGPARATATGLALFAIGLLVAGCVDRMAWLVVGRIVQGLGSGMIGVALYVGMGQLVPPALHPRLFAMFSAAWVLPGLFGPAIAAALVEHLGWRSVFLLAAAATPVAAALLLPAFRRLPAPPRGDDAPAASLTWAALAVAGALLLHEAGGAEAGWRALPILALGLGGALLAARRLLPAGSLTMQAGLPAVIALRGVLSAAFGTAEVFIPLYLTRMAGWSLGQAGLALSAGAVLWSLGSSVQSRIEAPALRRRGLRIGLLAVALGIAVVALPLLLPVSTWVSIAGWSLAGFGIGLGLPMLSVLTLALSVPADRGRNASALQLCDALCTSAALAVAGALFARVGPVGAPGFLMVLGFAAVLALVGAVYAGRAFSMAATEPWS